MDHLLFLFLSGCDGVSAIRTACSGILVTFYNYTQHFQYHVFAKCCYILAYVRLFLKRVKFSISCFTVAFNLKLVIVYCEIAITIFYLQHTIQMGCKNNVEAIFYFYSCLR